ncbi:RDD family protein [Chryseobacterium sp. C-71]|uniref:RDD family protein n=1 Tax=Chryseobacterium sp. C-71 TaxID=2893882 RepID=UPI001E3D603C|nr:RDD family protein [Chryseobacterium sp. C-71]UFH32835.1 RDD family protein [Chryseobacterium sp. C-71]
MRISELTERKTTRRATRNFDSEGRRIYNEFEYDLPYKIDFYGSDQKRQVAKFIDMILFFLVLYFIFHLPIIYSFIGSIPLVIIFGSITETLWGTTLGKKIFKIKVIDDYGNYPEISKSLKRNFLCLANFYPKFSEHTTRNVAFGTQTRFRTDLSMHMNNKLCHTYTIKESQLLEIKKLLEQKK